MTSLGWGNSATHYLRDAADGVPWETRLPGHRPVVDERTEWDLIGGTSVTTRYRYRDGYYDGNTGAFRGFGRVETLDTPLRLTRPGGGDIPGGGAATEPAFAPPLLTRTWFHLGTPMWNHHRPFEPYSGDAMAPRLPAHVDAPGVHRPDDLSAAYRLLAGAVVRRERWAVDAEERPVAHPFDVEQASYQLALVQARRGNERPVFGQLLHERLVAAYEGVGGDPRVTHEVVVAFDAWGAPTRTAQVAYARRGAVDDPGQARTWITVSDARRTDVDAVGQFVLGAEVETAAFDLVGVAAGSDGRIAPAALASAAVTAALGSPGLFEQALDPAATSPAARRLAWRRTYYWNDARDGAAVLGAIGAAPRRHHVDDACLTPGLVAATLGTRVDAAGLAALGYATADGHLWCASPVERVAGPFGLPGGTVRGDGATTVVRYDADWLASVGATDALGLDTAITVDYRVLAPAVTVGPSGTAAQVAYDAQGRAAATGMVGHVGAAAWQTGTTVGWAPAGATLAAVLADPAAYVGAAATATYVDDRAWERDGAPVAEVTVARSALVADGAGGGDAAGPLEVRVRYLDGFGRVLQEKVRVEAGPAIQRDGSGAVVVDAGGRPVLAAATVRWRVSGHVVYDAKGQPGRVFEPYFSPSAGYESDAALARFGVSTLTTYDAVGRAVRVDLPNGTYTRTAVTAWSTTAWSPSDTVATSLYRALREGLPAGDAERAAYEHAARHAATPVVTYVDARGVACATQAVGDATAAEAWTRQLLDTTGQAQTLVDARGLAAFTYARDLRGRVLATGSVDAGPTWTLADAWDRPVWSWDARGFAVERGFDVADRPTTVHVRGGDGAVALDAVVEAYRYGDAEPDRAAAVAANTVGRLVEVKDGAGVVAVTAYDPTGAVRAQARRLRAAVDEAPDWRGAESVEAEALATAARTHTLGREVWTQLADGTVRTTAYHPGGAVAEVRVKTPDGAVETAIVDGLARDAHGRVVAAMLGNGVGQTWAYDAATGRLVAQDAVKGTRAYQGLRLTYDPDGKLVRMLDVAQDGPGALVPGAVSARRDFGYDAHGRLIEATGRVHQALLPHDGPTTAGCVHGARHLSLDNGAALERYTQRFSYDVAGNVLRVQHAGTTASWASDYWVAADSNRGTAAADENGVPVVNPAGMFDAGGNLRSLWHLRALGWSWRGCLTHAVTVARATGPVDDGERYAYGADRVRVRKVATRLVVGGAEPVVETREVVYCGGGQERVRVRRGATLVLERWTTHVADGERRVAVIDRHVVDALGAEVDAIGPARVRYHLTTPQGSTAVELDETGLLVSYEEYLPFGGSAFVAGDAVREVARRDVRYAGKERDRATGLDAYPQRYYAPWLGRWLSPDPIGPKDGLNLYAFVGGDPVGYVDPEGTERKHGKHTELPLTSPPVEYPQRPQAPAGWVPFFSEDARSDTDAVAASVAPRFGGQSTTRPPLFTPVGVQERCHAEFVDAGIKEGAGDALADLSRASAATALFVPHQDLLGMFHQVEAQRAHVEAANKLVGLSLEKWGPGIVSRHLWDYDFAAITVGVRPEEVAPLLSAVEQFLADKGEAKISSAFASASAAFGNAITFGYMGWANRKAGLDDAYNESSDAFQYGGYAGMVAGIALTGGFGAARYGAARAASLALTGAGTGLAFSTLQTGAAALDGEHVTWRSYLQRAGASMLYGAYAGNAFGLATSGERAAFGVVGGSLQVGQGALKISRGDYAQGSLDLGAAGLGGYLALRAPVSSSVRTADLLDESPSTGAPAARPDAAAGGEFLDDAIRTREQPHSLVTVYRGQGRPLLAVDENGDVAIARIVGRRRQGVSLHVGFDRDRAQMWIGDLERDEIVRFQVKAEFLEKLRAIAVPEHGVRHDRSLPWRVDVDYPDQFAIPPAMFGELEKAIVPGSGQIFKKGDF